jgi:hypothetical protein
MIKLLGILMVVVGSGCTAVVAMPTWRGYTAEMVRPGVQIMTPIPRKSFYKQHFPHSEKPWPSNRPPKWTERRPTQVV